MTTKFEIKEFKPQEILITLQQKADQYRGLTISGIEDKV